MMRHRSHVLAALLTALIVVASACSILNGSDTTTTSSTTTTTTSGSAADTGETPPPETSCTLPDPEVRIAEVVAYISDRLMADYQVLFHDEAYTTANCWHVWDTDDCSVPVGKDTSVAKDFAHPCHRHDFGYRNYKRIEETTTINAWTEAVKLVVDDQFLADAREVCASRSFFEKQVCLGWAQVFYWAVRAFGGFSDELLD